MGWIGAVGSIAGGLLGGGGASSAAKAQAKATKAAVKEQAREFDLARADQAPWLQAGTAGINQLAFLLGLSPTAGGSQSFESAVGPMPTREQFMTPGNPGGWTYGPDGVNMISSPSSEGTFNEAGYQAALEDWNRRKSEFESRTPAEGFGSLNRKFTLADFWSDPVTQASYQQGLDQGTKALANMAGARGNRNSGAQLKALTRFATDYTGNQAAGSYGRYYGDQDRTYNRLAGIAGTGQTAASNLGQLGQGYANSVSNLLTAQGNARGAASIAGANAIGGGLQSAGNTLAKYFGSTPSTYGGGYSWDPSQFGGGDAWQ